MNIGPLDHRIRIEQQGATTDATYGAQLGAWTTFATVWAGIQEVLPSRAHQVGLPDIRVNVRTTRLRMRYRDDINATMRIVLLDRGNRVMRIISGPAEIGRRDGIELLIEEFTTVGDAA